MKRHRPVEDAVDAQRVADVECRRWIARVRAAAAAHGDDPKLPAMAFSAARPASLRSYWLDDVFADLPPVQVAIKAQRRFCRLSRSL